MFVTSDLDEQETLSTLTNTGIPVTNNQTTLEQ